MKIPKSVKIFIVLVLCLIIVIIFLNFYEIRSSKGYVKLERTDIEKLGIKEAEFQQVLDFVKKITHRDNFYAIIAKSLASDPNEPSNRTYWAQENKQNIKVYCFVSSPKHKKYYSLSNEPYIEIIIDKRKGKLIYLCDYTDVYLNENGEEKILNNSNDYKKYIQDILEYYGYDYNDETLGKFQIETREMYGKIKILMRLKQDDTDDTLDKQSSSLPDRFYMVFNSKSDKIQYLEVQSLVDENVVPWSYSPNAESYKKIFRIFWPFQPRGSSSK